MRLVHEIGEHQQERIVKDVQSEQDAPQGHDELQRKKSFKALPGETHDRSGQHDGNQDESTVFDQGDDPVFIEQDKSGFEFSGHGFEIPFPKINWFAISNLHVTQYSTAKLRPDCRHIAKWQSNVFF